MNRDFFSLKLKILKNSSNFVAPFQGFLLDCPMV